MTENSVEKEAQRLYENVYRFKGTAWDMVHGDIRDQFIEMAKTKDYRAFSDNIDDRGNLIRKKPTYQPLIIDQFGGTLDLNIRKDLVYLESYDGGCCSTGISIDTPKHAQAVIDALTEYFDL